MYVSKPDKLLSKKKKFLAALKRTGWSITVKPLRIDLLARYKAIIMSGDDIFVSVVRELRRLGIKVEVWIFKKSGSQALVKEVGKKHIHYFDDILDQIQLTGEESQT
ncbi:MAG: NYN domain-containing protein [Candidatus Hermodarchaeota archaeon]